MVLEVRTFHEEQGEVGNKRPGADICACFLIAPGYIFPLLRSLFFSRFFSRSRYVSLLACVQDGMLRFSNLG